MITPDAAATIARARQRLVALRNVDGGWAYAPGKRSRIEPTCWGLLALAPAGGSSGSAVVFARWSRDGDRFVDGPSLPASNVHNALAGVALLHDGVEGERLARSVAGALIASKGIATPRSDIIIQDNSLQGWGWVDGTTSWVEPTAWCVLLLKQLRRRGEADSGIEERIAVGDRLLLDRACRDGGWNYGNAIVYGKELWPYAQTTALALIALQDHREHPIVRQALYRLGRDARREGSALALSFATLCLHIHGISAEPLEQQLISVMAVDTEPELPGDVLGLALSLCAVDPSRAAAALTI